jgi:hypothetical protein
VAAGKLECEFSAVVALTVGWRTTITATWVIDNKATLAIRHKLPAMSSSRRQAAQAYDHLWHDEMLRKAGAYVGRILRRDKPG